MNIFNSRLKTIFVLFPFVVPHLFDEVPLINGMFNILQLFIFVLIFIKFGFKNISKIIYLLLFYRLSLLIPTVLNGGSVYTWVALTFKILSICYIADVALKINYQNFLKSFIFIVFFQILINLGTYWFDFSNLFEIESNVHFLGIRTRFIDVLFPFLAIVILSQNLSSEKVNWFYYLAVILTILVAWIATGIVGLLIFTGIYYFAKNNDKVINKLTFGKLSLIALVFNVSVIFFRIQNVFGFFIEDVLHKSLTFTGRTYIWDLAIEIINQSPLIGHGVNSNGAFVYLWGNMWMAHCQLLQSLYEGGIVNVIFFSLIVFSCAKKIKKEQTQKICFPIIIMLFTLFIMMIAERYLNYSLIYLLFMLIYNAGYAKCKKEEDFYVQN